jgi:hypothetical protein
VGGGRPPEKSKTAGQFSVFHYATGAKGRRWRLHFCSGGIQIIWGRIFQRLESFHRVYKNDISYQAMTFSTNYPAQSPADGFTGMIGGDPPPLCTVCMGVDRLSWNFVPGRASCRWLRQHLPCAAKIGTTPFIEAISDEASAPLCIQNVALRVTFFPLFEVCGAT